MISLAELQRRIASGDLSPEAAIAQSCEAIERYQIEDAAYVAEHARLAGKVDKELAALRSMYEKPADKTRHPSQHTWNRPTNKFNMKSAQSEPLCNTQANPQARTHDYWIEFHVWRQISIFRCHDKT